MRCALCAARCALCCSFPTDCSHLPASLVSPHPHPHPHPPLQFHIKLFILIAFAKFVDAMETAMLPLLFPVLKEAWHLKNTDLACVACASQIGMLIGAVSVGRVSDSVGRRLPLQLSLAWLMVFGLASAFSPNIYVFIVFRGFLGIGYGGNMVMAYTLLAEVLPTKWRGMCLAALDIFFGLGALASTLLCWLVIPTLGWRWLVVICILLCLPVTVGVFFFPDSPRYQCATGQYEKCIRTLTKIAKDNKKEMPKWMTLENMKVKVLRYIPRAHALSATRSR